MNERLLQIRRAHASAKPTPQNPAWFHTHNDLSFVLDCLDAETKRWEEALRLTWQMVDPLKPAGAPGSYWRGQDAGIVAALTTLRANLKTPNVEVTGA